MTLIEILVAFVVLAVSTLGLFSLGSMSTTGNNRNSDQIAAASLAGAKLEDLRSVSDIASLTDGSDGPLTAGGASGGIFSRSWTVTATSIPGVSTPARILIVRVTWTGGGSTEMSTLVVQPSQVLPPLATALDTGFPTVALKAMEQVQ